MGKEKKIKQNSAIVTNVGPARVHFSLNFLVMAMTAPATAKITPDTIMVVLSVCNASFFSLSFALSSASTRCFNIGQYDIVSSDQ